MKIVCIEPILLTPILNKSPMKSETGKQEEQNKENGEGILKSNLLIDSRLGKYS